MNIRDYIREIQEIFFRGDATEESFYPTLAGLLESYAKESGRHIYITQLPKRTEAGNPDFRVWDGRRKIIGYIEAKYPEERDLFKIEKSEQIKRYRNTFPNLILTNFIEFRLYRNGELTDVVELVEEFSSIFNQTRRIVISNANLFYLLIDKFLSYTTPKLYKAKDLATELAKRTQLLKDIVFEEINSSEERRNSELFNFYNIFKKYLFDDLSKEDFSDLYSQTIVYGLFAARTRSSSEFHRKLAYDQIPKTIGILRDIFRYISVGDIPSQMEWIIDDISDLLAESDVYTILDEYFHQNKGSDPIVHFYETFLSKYAPDIREHRGVYYTPEPVVQYIVRSINEILKTQFGKDLGLGSNGVTVLDPSAGTLTFLAEATRLAINEFVARYGTGKKEQFIQQHILQSFYAFEIMMAPYAIGHLKISFLLEELGYKLRDSDRFKFYLTNTLEMESLEQTTLPYISTLSEEAQSALDVKKSKPILVILGNPPYSGHSANKGKWISQEIKEYYQVDGKPLGEKNPKWLQDDYVKFIRFGQWKINQSGEGILAFITNHSYLDNPTFRGMRKSLIDSFDQIYILNLHGNTKKKELAPTGKKDENVFDIQQGVAIGLFIKKPGLTPQIFYSELWGIRSEKYEWLSTHSWENTPWKRITPKKENYLFVPHKMRYSKQYEEFPKITEIFPVYSVGIVTARDQFTIRWSKEELWRDISEFIQLDPEKARQRFGLGKDARDWKVAFAQEDLRNSGPQEDKIVPILYRPFDIRFTYYTGRSRGFHCMPRAGVMKNMLQDNIGLITIRRSRSSHLWNFALVTDKIISGSTAISPLDINYLFPLYVYEESGGCSAERKRGGGMFKGVMLLFESSEAYYTRKPNLSSSLFEWLNNLYQKATSPEDVFYYIYAVLYSNIYREDYSELLKIDFPRIPFSRSYEHFKKMSKYGAQLSQLHLLRDNFQSSISIRFQGKGDAIIEKVEYEGGKIFINKTQYFEKIAEHLWDYHIGDYQILEKWLRDRKGRELQIEDVKYFGNIVNILDKTIQIQLKIDKVFEQMKKDF